MDSSGESSVVSPIPCGSVSVAVASSNFALVDRRFRRGFGASSSLLDVALEAVSVFSGSFCFCALDVVFFEVLQCLQ